MKYMVMSTPQPGAPSQMRGRQAEFWDWLSTLEATNVVEHCFVKVGRGAILVFDVPDHETLHRLIGEWSDRIAAEFTVIPLVDRGYQEAVARRG